MISHTCKTAIKAVIYLATQIGNEKKSSIKDIAKNIGANGHTVGKTLQTLVKQGIIKSAKGPLGGFYITREQQYYPLIRIVESVEGKQLFTGCGLGLSLCSEQRPCPIHDPYEKARKVITNIFTRSKISDLAHPVDNGLAYLSG